MYKQYKKIKNKIVILIFFLVLLLISIGYAYLSQNIQIQGKATIRTEQNEEATYIVTYTIDGKWSSNGKYIYQITITILNNSNKNIDGWKISIKLPEDGEIIQCYNANYAIENNKMSFENVSYNSLIPAKQSVSFQFHIATTNENYKPSDIIINGTPIIPPETSPEEPDKPTEPEEPDKPGNNELKANIKVNKASNWQSEEHYFYQFEIDITNIGKVTINSWKFDIEFKENMWIDQIWNATYNSTMSNIYTFQNLSYNGTIESKSTVSFGMIVKTTNSNLKITPTNIILK